jgi:hypothetical protein
MNGSPLPDRRVAMRRLLALPLACLPATRATASQDERGWTPLFNGTNFDGWETYLGRPHRSSDVAGARDERGEYVEPVGVGRDPKGVFSIVPLDGAPAIRVSGEIYGALTTVRAFGDYHLRFEFKWGRRKWPPREQAARDTGCCYHAVGPHGKSFGFWMQSCEFQIMEGDCGDFYGLAGVIVDVDAVLQDLSNPKTTRSIDRAPDRFAIARDGSSGARTTSGPRANGTRWSCFASVSKAFTSSTDGP